MFALLAALMFLFLNLTNDMIYSPDMVLVFIISCGFSIQSSKLLD